MKTIAFISGLSLLLFSCNNQKLEEQVAQLALERDEIKAEVSQRDASLEKFMSSFTDIEKNLREIREREMNIELARAEGKLGPEALGEKIKEDVKAINSFHLAGRDNGDWGVRRCHHYLRTGGSGYRCTHGGHRQRIR